jgi:3-deoxy-alpha-D-manno-octulosonate 8-oxidase
MNVMEEFYPHATEEFKRMMQIHGITLPQGLCSNLSEQQYRALYDATIIHSKPLSNALGDGFRDILSYDKVVAIFRRM